MVLIFTKKPFFLLKQICFLMTFLTTLKEQRAQILLFLLWLMLYVMYVSASLKLNWGGTRHR